MFLTFSLIPADLKPHLESANLDCQTFKYKKIEETFWSLPILQPGRLAPPARGYHWGQKGERKLIFFNVEFFSCLRCFFFFTIQNFMFAKRTWNTHNTVELLENLWGRFWTFSFFLKSHFLLIFLWKRSSITDSVGVFLSPSLFLAAFRIVNRT